MLLLAVLAGGCFPGRVPTQAHPSCSWASEVPAHADALCVSVFQTLSTTARASVRGDDATIRALVPSRAVARRIISYSRKIRAQRVVDLHVVPSITMEQRPNGEIGAGFYLLGKTKTGQINAPQTMYLRLRGGSARIVRDQPGQEW